ASPIDVDGCGHAGDAVLDDALERLLMTAPPDRDYDSWPTGVYQSMCVWTASAPPPCPPTTTPGRSHPAPRARRGRPLGGCVARRLCELGAAATARLGES